MLTGVRSWRAAKKAELIRWDADRASLCARVETRGRSFALQLDMPASGRSQIHINGVKKQRQLELSECLRCVAKRNVLGVVCLQVFKKTCRKIFRTTGNFGA